MSHLEVIEPLDTVEGQLEHATQMHAEQPCEGVVILMLTRDGVLVKSSRMGVDKRAYMAQVFQALINSDLLQGFRP